jgi:predicted dehydrogenase
MPQRGIAVIGAGSIAGYHLTGLAGVEGAAVRVVASRTEQKARALAQQHGVADATSDVGSVLARHDVDAVVITAPDDTHEEIATAAAAAGKAILLQKPMAPTSAGCQRIIAAAARAGVDLQVSYMHRHFEEVVEAARLMREGLIGEVKSVRVRNATPGPDWADWFFAAGRVIGGVVHQLGVHGIDLVEHLFGPIAEASAWVRTLVPTRRLADGRVVKVENADSAWATYQLASGGVVSHEMSLIEMQGCDRFRMEIYGTRGTMWLRTERGPLAIYAPQWRGRSEWVVPPLPAPPFGRRQHQRWIDGLTGAAPPERTAQAGLRGLLVAEAIQRSSDAGGGCQAIPPVQPDP